MIFTDLPAIWFFIEPKKVLLWTYLCLVGNSSPSAFIKEQTDYTVLSYSDEFLYSARNVPRVPLKRSRAHEAEPDNGSSQMF